MIARTKIAALAKATRAAIILPGLFGFLLFFVKDVQAAGFAVFGTFAHLVMTNYGPQRSNRVAQVVTLTFCGLVMITWGTAVSTQIWLAVPSAGLVGFTTQTARLFGDSIAAGRTVALLAFMLAVTSPASPVNIVPRLGGWALSGVIALMVLLATWISLGLSNPAQLMIHAPSAPELPLADEADSRLDRKLCARLRSFLTAPNSQPDWFASSARAAVATALAVLISGVFKFEHGFWIVLGILPILRASDTAQARTFLQEQGGTLAGFISSAVLVAIVQSHREIYWIALPVTAFVAAYASTAVGFVAGQAAFTLFVVVVLNILAPLGFRAGILRLEDIAIGGAISLFLGIVYPTGRKPSRVSARWQHPQER
jgi:Fusaric acid resistance protein-like